MRPRPPMQCTATPSALDMRDDIVRGGDHELVLTVGIVRRPAADEVLQPERVHGARRRVVRREVVREAHHMADPFRRQSGPVGASGIRHAGQRDRGTAHPVQIVGDAQIAEEPGRGPDRQQARRHDVTAAMVNHALNLSPGFTSGSVPRPIASIVAVIGSIAANSPRAGTYSCANG